ncbi:DNA-protecting protein DprA [Moritella sp. 36]|uniref:DNA-processing protein DprA n=1 Tax=Moritella sp. 36 TaxID=2746233 RepID=UPI001BAD4A73|nr:DNA-processing protein DprA [Moritella sp. 36]QUM87411.1 DNA-protecting protein DprA [Moritella sp. 36]
MVNEQDKYWLALYDVPKIGGSRALRLLKKTSLTRLFTGSVLYLQSLGLDTAQQQSILNPDWQAIESTLNWLADEPERYLIPITSSDYPLTLKNIGSPPLLLYVEGNVELLSKPQIAMVGTRDPSYYGKRHAHSFAAGLVQEGLVVTSGLAIGVDSECHRSVLAAKGHTIAVLGTGLANIYPKRHQQLAQQIREQGALVSEFSPFTQARPEHFPRRNRIVSGLSLGVVVIEAALNSGSLISARYAVDQGREVFALSGAIDNPMAAGCHYLIQQGAKLITQISDITDELTYINVSTNSEQTDLFSAVPETVSLPNQIILDSVGYEVTTADIIAEHSQQPVSQVLTSLIELELDNWVCVVPGGYVRSQRRG